MEATNKNINFFPVFSQLHDDSQAQASPQGEIPETLRVGFSRVMALAKPKRRTRKKRQTRHRAQSIDHVFECGQDALGDTRKALLSMAFLLEWASEGGNRDVRGTMANGLAYALKLSAKDAEDYLINAAGVRP